MSNLKKTAMAVLVLSSGAVFAGTMGPVCSAVNVTVPCESTAWDLGARALFLQSSVNGQGASVNRSIQTGSGRTASVGENPKYGWGFQIEGSYHFNTGNDLNLNWYHINNSRTHGFNGSKSIGTDIVSSGAAGGILTQVTGSTTYVNKQSATIRPHWDAVNLEFGQHVDFGEDKSIRFHGGFEYARIAADTSNTIAGSVTTATGATPSYNGSWWNNPTYNGFGPRLGADMKYDWGNGLGIYANGAAGILAGSSKFSSTQTNNLSGYSYTVSGSSMVIVPELDAKLGVNYSYALAQGDLTLDVGWLWVNYFNAVRSQGNPASAVLGSAPVATGDFGLQGLYFGLNWVGNVA